MAECIDRQKAIEQIKAEWAKLPLTETTGFGILMRVLKSIPAADVRPVVVCADCEHNNHCLTQEFVDDCGKIPLDRSTFFCADGERRNNA